jgi:hypothetical protein
VSVNTTLDAVATGCNRAFHWERFFFNLAIGMVNRHLTHPPTYEDVLQFLRVRQRWFFGRKERGASKKAEQSSMAKHVWLLHNQFTISRSQTLPQPHPAEIQQC